MKKTIIFTLLLALVAVATPVFAASSILKQAAAVCDASLNSGDAAVVELGFTESSAKPQNPFGEKVFEKKADGQTLIVTTGKKFRKSFCELYLPNGTQEDYQAIRAELAKQFNTDGVNYDDSVDGKPYRGEIWSDKEAMDNGNVSDLKLEGTKLASLFIQFSAVKFRQTQDRTGLILEMMKR
ncbi:hypothetical protein [Maridesulfovibrio zosterae]|uniref:hypothetical protein n=1 Tax=Maridesulfovibrio zosterae TaxID=82171 RepID=UPI0003F79D43|nr:hypothetical protein [Maridesulfovibrio zosterae]